MQSKDYVVGYLKKGLKIKPGDVRLSGDPVPETRNWKPNVFQSHLSLQWIQTKEQYAAQKQQYENRSQKYGKKAQPVLTPKTTSTPQPVLETLDTSLVDDDTETVDTRTEETEQVHTAKPLYTKTGLGRKKVAELAALAHEHELSAEGTKKELIAMLLKL